jgi:hypothetical protein
MQWTKNIRRVWSRLPALLALLLLQFCGLPDMLPAQELPTSATSLQLPKSEPNTPTPKASSASSWQTLLTSWETLKTELTASEQDWQTLLTLLDGLQTEQSGLQSSLTQLTAHCEILASTLETDRAAIIQSAADDRDRADQADKKAQFWTITGTIAIISTVFAVFLHFLR